MKFRIFAKIMKSERVNSISWTAAVPVVVGVAVYAFWYLGHPEVLMSQEQSQLFVWDAVYLHDRLEMPGGLGDYLWSGVVQFFCSFYDGIALRCIATLVNVAVSSAFEEEMARGVSPVVVNTTRIVVCDGLQTCRWLDGGAGI